MKARRTDSERPGSLWRFWAAAACLLAWVLSTPGLVPAFACVLGELDGQHEVSIAEGRDTTVVVLHHEGGVPKPHHQHSLLSGMLVAFSQSDRDTQDHLLIFPRSEVAVSEEPFLSADAAAQEVPRPCEVRTNLLDLERNGVRDGFRQTVRSGCGLLCRPVPVQAARALRI